MFNSDITQTYNHQDATIDILIMLAGAFLLGCLLCWLIKKLFEKDKQIPVMTASHSIDSGSMDLDKRTTSSLADDESQLETTVDSTDYSRPKIDDLTKITGIDLDVESELKNRGVKSFIDLRDCSKESIIGTLDSPSGKSVVKREARTWPHQASLAAKGDWDKLKEYQEFMARSIKTSDKINSQKGDNNSVSLMSDNLKRIEGIGPKIEEVLNANGINSFKDLRKSDRDTLKNHLDNAGKRFKMHEPESWPHQAGMAEKGEWEDLAIYQEFMDGGRETPSATASMTPETKQPSKQTIVSDIKESSVNKVTSDDLQKIEGIGPKIEEVLNNNGIFTFKQLHHTDRDVIKEYLNDAGNQFKMHEPNSWPHQAGMADREDWEDLKVYQEFMDGGREIPSSSAFSKIEVPVQPIIDDVEADFLKELSNEDVNDTDSVTTPSQLDETSEIQKDDLKRIEGIGPKIQALLNKADINTFQDLKNSNRDFIKGLLDEAGPQYRMHEPETWPLQARMAYKGEWKKLEEYQEVLMGRG